MRKIGTGTLLAALLLAACAGEDEAPEAAAVRPAAPPAQARTVADRVDVYGEGPERRMTREELERGRMDMSWQRVVQLDTAGAGAVEPIPETWEEITPRAVNGAPMHLPISGDVAGPSVLRVQVLLDRAHFSPGIMDGRWGKNTAQAVYWFQEKEGLRATARVDSATFQRLQERAGRPGEIVVRHTLTAEEVEGPFVQIPEDIYAHAELECSCYESLEEKLSERFHATPELLGRLNQGKDLNALAAGESIWVPAVLESGPEPQGSIAKLVVSGEGNYLHAVDAGGRILYHFPTTLGARYSPSPQGDFHVTSVTPDPKWYYQPDILDGVPDDEPEATIPPGPNVAVGVVWIDLSEPHFGIHGTSAPETIGYATSNGCVRLTNWDVTFLSDKVAEGTDVEFRDIQGRSGGGGTTVAPGDTASAR